MLAEANICGSCHGGRAVIRRLAQHHQQLGVAARRLLAELLQGPATSAPNLEEGRRLYQPKVKGEKAQFQVWSEIEQRWIPIKDYPSLY